MVAHQAFHPSSGASVASVLYLTPLREMVPHGGIEPTFSRFVAECSVRYTNGAFEMASGVRIELTHVDLESSSPSLGTWPDI